MRFLPNRVDGPPSAKALEKSCLPLSPFPLSPGRLRREPRPAAELSEGRSLTLCFSAGSFRVNELTS